ncbi:hypothetical protein F2P56_010103 [Juglans regia]|uniref:Uncharacterized protein n=1 Tax=Juglans regia TaxID=51240 RepID=A0A833XYK5_JUGRE|nr:hypothetical protein F2P56_010103 [Juglans regia]
MEAIPYPSALVHPRKPYLLFWTQAVASPGSPAPHAISAPIAPPPASTRPKSSNSFQNYRPLRRFWVAKTPNAPHFLAQMSSLGAKTAVQLHKTVHRVALLT